MQFTMHPKTSKIFFLSSMKLFVRIRLFEWAIQVGWATICFADTVSRCQGEILKSQLSNDQLIKIIKTS